MKTIRRGTWAQWLCLFSCLVLTVTAVPAKAAAITGIVAFGDSLSDAGNDYLASSGAVPGPGYPGMTFTNGTNWVQQLAVDLHVPVPTPSVLGGTDYAFGGAQSGSGTTSVDGYGVPNVAGQISMFLQATGGVASPSQLYTIWAGGNDAILGTSPNPITSVQNIVTDIQTLAKAGATQFAVPNLPPLDKIPLVTLDHLTTAQQQALGYFSTAFDAILPGALSQLAMSLGIQIHLVDVNQIFNNASSYGFTNVTDPLMLAAGSPNASSYLFWDQEHPTTAADSVIASVAAQEVVPEPASIFLYGSVLLGIVALKRARTARRPSQGLHDVV